MMPIQMTADGTTLAQGDEKLLVRFYLMEILNESRSESEGINKYDDVEMVEILIPGCRDNCVRKASDQDKLRFRRQYAAFLNTKGEGREGTPLSQFPFISPAERKELEYYNIYTGENISDLQDGYIDRIPLDMRSMIPKVKAFMNYAKDTAATVKTATENEALKRKISTLEEQMMKILLTIEKDKLNGNRSNEDDSNQFPITEQRVKRGRTKRNSNEHAKPSEAS
jgi:hypothetical protein